MIKFEAAQIYFLSEVFVTVTIAVAQAPYYSLEGGCLFRGGRLLEQGYSFKEIIWYLKQTLFPILQAFFWYTTASTDSRLRCGWMCSRFC